MRDVDLANQNKSIIELPSDIRNDLAFKLSHDLFAFSKMVGFVDITPRCHGPICIAIDKNKTRFYIFLLPRGHLKTSLITIAGGLQKVTQDSEHRISIVNAVSKKAVNMLLAIRTIVDSNTVFRTLYSDIIPTDPKRWNSEGLEFVRQGNYPDPTISAYGMDGTQTSSHFTHQIWDDPIEESAYDSPDVMKNALTRMSGIRSLMVNPGQDSVWLVGTQWTINDVFTHHKKLWKDDATIIIRSIVEGGEIIFPEKMGDFNDIAALRQSMTSYRFSCWYMNKPKDESIQTFNTSTVKYWTWDAKEEYLWLLDSNNNVHRIVHKDSLDITTTVDLAAAEKKTSDFNAVVTTGVTPWAEVIVLDSWAERCSPGKVMDKLFEIKARFHPRAFGIEDVAYQKVFKWFLRTEADKKLVHLNVVPLKAVGKKERRISGLQPLVNVGRLYLNRAQFTLLQQAEDFPLGEYDDELDALSMQQQLWRGVMDPEYLKKLQEAEKKAVAEIMAGRGSISKHSEIEEDMKASMGDGWAPI